MYHSEDTELTQWLHTVRELSPAIIYIKDSVYQHSNKIGYTNKRTFIAESGTAIFYVTVHSTSSCYVLSDFMFTTNLRYFENQEGHKYLHQNLHCTHRADNQIIPPPQPPTP